MAAIHYHSKARTLDAKIWDGTTLADITTLAGQGASIGIGSLTIIPAGGDIADAVTVPVGQYLCKDGDGLYTAQTSAAIALQWDEQA